MFFIKTWKRRINRIKNSYSAFQDIYMYISGVLGNTEKNMVQISDKDMLYKRGFNKWSFKKEGYKQRK